jgi:hypothetical protein
LRLSNPNSFPTRLIHKQMKYCLLQLADSNSTSSSRVLGDGFPGPPVSTRLVLICPTNPKFTARNCFGLYWLKPVLHGLGSLLP